ncbi:MAG: hypothetical protein ACI94Y_000047 [Maribacter sp.]|jgi:hypothetical protein
MPKKQLLQIFLKLGLIQVFPASIAIVFIIITSLILAGIIAITLGFEIFFTIIDNDHISGVSDEVILLALAIFCTITLLLFSEFMTLMLSSFYFIRAKQTNDYEKLSRGMKYLNWAWLILCLFLAIMLSTLIFQIITDI